MTLKLFKGHSENWEIPNIKRKKENDFQLKSPAGNTCLDYLFNGVEIERNDQNSAKKSECRKFLAFVKMHHKSKITYLTDRILSSIMHIQV